jgi:hypothetical protein
LCIGGAANTVSTPESRLWAPTYYIAAKVTFDGDPNKLLVAGASNLPTGAWLDVSVYRYMGEGGIQINQSATAVVGKEGFFEATLHPTKGNSFQHNLACNIVFATRTEPPQPLSVLRVVGTHGEHLGFPKNPQTGLMSGNNFYLDDLVHVP